MHVLNLPHVPQVREVLDALPVVAGRGPSAEGGSGGGGGGWSGSLGLADPLGAARASGWDPTCQQGDSDDEDVDGEGEGGTAKVGAKAAARAVGLSVGHAVRSAVLDCMATAWLQKQWPWAKAEIETTFQLAAERRLRFPKGQRDRLDDLTAKMRDAQRKVEKKGRCSVALVALSLGWAMVWPRVGRNGSVHIPFATWRVAPADASRGLMRARACCNYPLCAPGDRQPFGTGRQQHCTPAAQQRLRRSALREELGSRTVRCGEHCTMRRCSCLLFLVCASSGAWVYTPAAPPAPVLLLAPPRMKIL